MAEDLWKYLPHVPNTIKKTNPYLKRKSEVTDKQVLNLTGGVFPIKMVDPAKDALGIIPQKLDHWVYTPIRQSNQKIGEIYHWVKQGEQQKIYQGDKFNIQPKTIQFTEEQYKNININHQQWPYADVVDLFLKLKTFNFNFIVVHDRILHDKWSVEDLKDIFFTVNRLILQAREQKQNILSGYIFDKKYETNRKFELQKYLMRSKTDTDRQKFLMNQIRRLEIQIKKQQREQINLKRALKIDQVPEEVFKMNQITDFEELYKSQKVYSRQQLLSKPLQLPGKIDQKLNEVMHGLNIPDKIVANKQNMELYDRLRKRILVMFSIQRYIKKKDSQKRGLDDKRKRLTMMEQDNSKMYPLKNAEVGQPKKRHKS